MRLFTYFVAADRAMYSASVEERANCVCSLDCQKIGAFTYFKTKLVQDLAVLGSSNPQENWILDHQGMIGSLPHCTFLVPRPRRTPVHHPLGQWPLTCALSAWASFMDVLVVLVAGVAFCCSCTCSCMIVLRNDICCIVQATCFLQWI